jgi:uncharacterized surface protein with fasciclin (FAS1) repeats
MCPGGRRVPDGNEFAAALTILQSALETGKNRHSRRHLYVSGEQSGVAEVSISNVMQSNGVIHVVRLVLLPN